MAILNRLKIFLLAVMLFSGMALYAEESDLDKLLLEMDTLAEEVDSLKLGVNSIEQTIEGVKPEPSAQVVETKEEIKKNKESPQTPSAKEQKTKTVEVNKPIDSSKDNKSNLPKEASENKVTNVKAEVKPKAVNATVENIPSSDTLDGFGDFTASKPVANVSDGVRVVRGRDPFAPSISMVSEYQKKVDEARKKRKEAQNIKAREAELAKKVEQNKKDAQVLLKKQKAELAAQMIQARALALPKMKLKGFIRKPNKGVLALLDISGYGTHIVRQGDSVSLGAMGIIKIIKIKDMSLIIKSGEVDSTVVVR